MCEELDLGDVDAALELKDEFLRENTETLAVPALEIVWVTSIVCQLTDRMLCVLTSAVEDFEVEDGFTLACTDSRILVLSLGLLQMNLLAKVVNFLHFYF